MREMQDMTEPELRFYFNSMRSMLRPLMTPDAVGFMLIVFQGNGITQYGSSIDPQTSPQTLRELADRIEKRQGVTR